MQSGTYMYQTKNTTGCDSIVTLELTINDHIENTDVLSVCEGDSVEVFGNWISSAGVVSETFISSSGCDSIQTYDVTVIPLPKGQIKSGICEGDSIYIINRWFSKAGDFAIRKENANDCDSLIDVSITEIPIKTSYSTIDLCRGDTLRIFGNDVTDEGLQSRTFTGYEGCDSIVKIEVRMLEPVVSQQSIKLCPGDSIFINGVWIKSDSQTTEVLSGSNGCDSTSITHVQLIDEPNRPEMEIDCESREVKVSIAASEDWQILWDNGEKTLETTYKDKTEAKVSLKSIPDCDRSFTLMLPQIPDISLIKLPADTTIEKNKPLIISLDLDTTQWKLQWSPSDIINCTICKEVVITPSGNIDMKLLITHTSGCTYEVNFRIMLEKEEINVPNIFTPDGDGKNDLWKVKIPSDIDLKSCRVFDRWGEQVYSSGTGDTINWDGTFKGKKVGSGVYVYVLEYKNADGESRILKGDVTVVR
jgi:gliding motility-associated-like protein